MPLPEKHRVFVKKTRCFSLFYELLQGECCALLCFTKGKYAVFPYRILPFLPFMLVACPFSTGLFDHAPLKREWEVAAQERIFPTRAIKFSKVRERFGSLHLPR